MKIAPQNQQEERLIELIAGSIAETLKEDRQELNERISDLVKITALTNQTVQTMADMVEKHERLLRGNGNIGVVATLNRLAPMVDEMYKILKGEEDKPGMVSRVASLEGVRSVLSKPLWIVITVVLTFLATTVLELVIK